MDWVEPDDHRHAALPFEPPGILEYIKDILLGTWELAMYLLLIVAAILILSNQQNFRQALDSTAWWVSVYKTVVICYPGGIMMLQLMMVCEHCVRKFIFFRLLSFRILVVYDTHAIWRSWFVWFFSICFALLEIWSLYSVYQFWGRAETSGPEALSLVVWGVVTIVSIQLLVFINTSAAREKKLLTPMQSRVLPPLYVIREIELKREVWRGLASFFTCGGCGGKDDPPLLSIDQLRELAVLTPSTESPSQGVDAGTIELGLNDETPYEAFKTPVGTPSGSRISSNSVIKPPAQQGMGRGDEEAGGNAVTGAAAATDDSTGKRLSFLSYLTKCLWCCTCCPCIFCRYCCCCGVKEHTFALSFFFYLWPASLGPRVWPIRGDRKYFITILCTYLFALLFVGALLGFGFYVAVANTSYVCKIGNNACADCYIHQTEYVDYYAMCPWIGYNISYTHADNMCAVLNATQRNCTTDCAFFTNGVFQDLQLPIGQVYLPTAYLLANLAARAYATAFYNLPANANRQFEMRFSDYSFPMGLKATNFLFFESKFKYQTQSILATSDDDAVVLFRGTETTSDILFTDVATSCTSQSIIPNVGCLHDGFFQAFKVSYADTELALHRLLRLKNLSQSSAKIMYDGLGPTNGSIITTPPPQRRVWVAGHSLGGALAVLFATYAKGRGFNIAGVVSIGQPRVGKQQFVDAYTAMGLHNKTYRFVHRDDPIPMVPPESLGYRHAGQRFVVDSGSVTYRGDEGCINTFLGVCKVVLGDHMTPGYLNSMRSAIASSKVLESCAVNLLPASNDGF